VEARSHSDVQIDCQSYIRGGERLIEEYVLAYCSSIGETCTAGRDRPVVPRLLTAQVTYYSQPIIKTLEPYISSLVPDQE
jgi:hypothetical protein